MWKEPKDRHRHVKLIGGWRASEAQVYPRRLCEAIVEGIQRQIECDEWGVVKVKIDSMKQEEEETIPAVGSAEKMGILPKNVRTELQEIINAEIAKR